VGECFFWYRLTHKTVVVVVVVVAVAAAVAAAAAAAAAVVVVVVVIFWMLWPFSALMLVVKHHERHLHHVSKKTDMPIMSHNSSKNQTLSIIFQLFNRSSMLDTLPLKLLI